MAGETEVKKRKSMPTFFLARNRDFLVLLLTGEHPESKSKCTLPLKYNKFWYENFNSRIANE